jgi:hypothetical protein
MGEAGFARECARVGIAGIAQQAGFSGVQATAADTLANILHNCTPPPPIHPTHPGRGAWCFGCHPHPLRDTQTNMSWCGRPDIEEVGYRAHLYAELAGRIEANFNDVRLTFEELGLDLRELAHYSATLDETPFPKGLPPTHLPTWACACLPCCCCCCASLDVAGARACVHVMAEQRCPSGR